MLFDTIIPFREAISELLKRGIMPTGMGHAEIQALGKAVLDRSFWSARNTLTDILDMMKGEVGAILEPTTEIDPETNLPRTAGTDFASARLRIQQAYERIGYEPEPGKEGTIQDLSSTARVDLVLKTNAQIAQGYGYARQGQSEEVLDMWPCQELLRLEDRKVPRGDWPERWEAACAEAGDKEAETCFAETGRMVARKDSEVWQALGDGAGGFDDTLGNPYEPFAFNSGLGTQDVPRKESVELGLIDEDEQVEVVPLDYAMDLGELHNRVGGRLLNFNPNHEPAGTSAGGQFTSGDHTDTPEFKSWFGNSKVVDAKGKPLVVHHGSQNPGFNAFKISRSETGEGIFFSDNVFVAEDYAKGTLDFDEAVKGKLHDSAGIYSVHLKMENPATYDAKGEVWHALPMKRWIDDAKKAGHDGLVISRIKDAKYMKDMESTEYIVFHPTQIKSATGNSGKFNPKDSDLSNRR